VSVFFLNSEQLEHIYYVGKWKWKAIKVKNTNWIINIFRKPCLLETNILEYFKFSGKKFNSKDTEKKLWPTLNLIPNWSWDIEDVTSCLVFQ